MAEGYEMTAEGVATLREQLHELETAGRADMAAQIKTARGFGDLKENAEYHAAKEAQGHLETKIARLRDRLNHAVVVEGTGGAVAGFGSTVQVQDEATGARRTFKLVSSLDGAPAQGLLSMDSPFAQALRGRRAGDVAQVETPRGERRWRVVSVS
jgi:transcription elongation factor GreA